MRFVSAALLGIFGAALSAPAATVYLKSLDSGPFYSYDTTADAWTTHNSFTAQSQLSTDAAGNLYVVRDNAVAEYNPAADTWSPVSTTLAGASVYSNLEVINDGRFVYNVSGSSSLQVYNGSWTSHTLTQPLSLAADYDPSTGVFAACGVNSTTAYKIDLSTYTITATYTTPNTLEGENRRLGEILNGKFYGAGDNGGAATLGFYDYDLSNPAAPATPLQKLQGSAAFYPTGAADPTTNSIYVATIGSDVIDDAFNNFFRYDVASNAYVPLAAYPTDDFSYHNSLAFVVPEPASLALITLPMLLTRRRRPAGGKKSRP